MKIKLSASQNGEGKGLGWMKTGSCVMHVSGLQPMNVQAASSSPQKKEKTYVGTVFGC